MGLLSKLLGRQPVTAQYWQGEWDSDPIFFSLWQPKDGGDTQPLPEGYLGLPLPRLKGEFTFIGGSLPWRGLDVRIEVPNTEPASLVSEYWDGARWHRINHDKTHYNYATLNRSGTISCCPSERVWAERRVGEQRAYWIRFSVTNDLSPGIAGWADVIHNTPTLVSDAWTMKKHRLTPCENRPGLKMIYVKVLDENDGPIYEAEVGFDTKPSHGIVYDHPNFWGLTDENGYVSWNHLGIPTIYNLFVDGELAVSNIRMDLGNEYCGTGLGSWRPVNRPGIYSYWIELQRKGR